MLLATSDNVIVKLDPSETTYGAIELAPAAVEKSCTGIVISVGPGEIDNKGRLLEHNVNVGDHVLFGESALQFPITENDETYYIMKVQHLWGTI